VALTRRELLRATATPATTVQSIVFPALLLLVLLAVFGSAVEDFSGEPYVQRITPALIISGAAFGSLGAVSGLFADRRSGFFDRLRVAPLGTGADHRGLSAVVLARSASEHVRVAITAVAIVGVGSAVGFRFEAGLLNALAFFVCAVVFGACFGWIGFALAVRGSSMETVEPPVSALFLVLLFLSHGMVPLEAFPGWVQPFVQVAPSSLMMQTLQRLSGGGPVLAPLLGATAWTVAITVVFGRLAVTGLSRSDERQL
jgi:ABC transporter DrrB family efflux protein